MTVKNGKGKYLSMIDSAGNEYETVVGGRTTLTDKSKASVTMGAKVTTADATARTKAIKISGNALPNTIYGGSGVNQLAISNAELETSSLRIKKVTARM